MVSNLHPQLEARQEKEISPKSTGLHRIHFLGLDLLSAPRGPLLFFVKWPSPQALLQHANLLFKVNEKVLDTSARLVLDAYTFLLTSTTVHALEASSRSHPHDRGRGISQKPKYQKAGIAKINLKSISDFAKW